jgi:hypothetical protein
VTIERTEYEQHLREQVTVEEGGVVNTDGSHLSYEAWLADHEQTKVFDGGDIKVTDFLPGGPMSEYSSDTWIVVIGDTTYRYERWFTNNSGGVEWWDGEGNRVEDDPGEFIVLGQQIPLTKVVNNQRVPDYNQFREATLDDIIEEFTDRASAAYYTRHEELVAPIVKQIKEEIFPIFATP